MNGGPKIYIILPCYLYYIIIIKLRKDNHIKRQHPFESYPDIYFILLLTVKTYLFPSVVVGGIYLYSFIALCIGGEGTGIYSFSI